MISGHQGLLTSGDQDAKTSIRIDFLASLFHDGLSSRVIHPVLVQFCSRCRLRERAVRLFRLAGEQAGTGRDIRPVFESPEHYMVSGLSKLCFQLREIDFVTENSLPARGGNSSEVVVFYRAPHVPRPDFNRRRVSGTLRSKMGILEGIIASYGQKKRSRLSKAAPTNGDIMFRFSDENHIGFLTVITRYDEHSMACSISNRGRNTTLSSYT